jgi:hypothetical protein
VKVGDLVIFKGDVPFSNPEGDYTPGVVISLYCIHDEEERDWIGKTCQCVADVLWVGDPVMTGHVTKYLEVRNESG